MVVCMDVKSLNRQIGDSMRLLRSEGKRPIYTGRYPTQEQPQYRTEKPPGEVYNR